MDTLVTSLGLKGENKSADLAGRLSEKSEIGLPWMKTFRFLEQVCLLNSPAYEPSHCYKSRWRSKSPAVMSQCGLKEFDSTAHRLSDNSKNGHKVWPTPYISSTVCVDISSLGILEFHQPWCARFFQIWTSCYKILSTDMANLSATLGRLEASDERRWLWVSFAATFWLTLQLLKEATLDRKTSPHGDIAFISDTHT